MSDRAHGPHRRGHGLQHGRARGRLLDDERRLAQRVDQLRAPERLRRDRLRDGRRAALGAEDARRALPGGRASRSRSSRSTSREPRPGRGRRRDGGGRNLRHRPAPGQGRVAAADADGARPRGRRRRRGRSASAVTAARAGRRGRALVGARRAATATTACAGGPRPACRCTRRSAPGTLVDGTTGISFDGETVYRGTATGALAERVVVVSKRGRCRPAAAIPLREAALLGCAALTGVGAVLFAARVSAGSSVLVLGGGGVGQFVVQGARIAGAGDDRVRRPASRPGASRRSSSARRTRSTRTSWRRARRRSRPEGVDYAFDAVGDPATTRRRAPLHAQRRHDA